MDDAAREQKIRSLKIRIMQVEKEIAAKMHGSHLNAFLSVGHAAQIAKASERDRKRLEEKLDELKKQLHALDPSYAPPPEKKVEAPTAPAPAAPAKPKKAETPAKPKAIAKPDTKKKTATKTTKKPAKKTK